MRVALIIGREVVNIAEADSTTVTAPYEKAIELPADSAVDRGWQFDKDQFLPPKGLTWQDDLAPEYWQISLTALLDRFDRFCGVGVSDTVFGMPQLQGMIRNFQTRSCIDLRHPGFIARLPLIRDAVPEITEEMTDLIMLTPTTEDERVVKKLPQPE